MAGKPFDILLAHNALMTKLAVRQSDCTFHLVFRLPSSSIVTLKARTARCVACVNRDSICYMMYSSVRTVLLQQVKRSLFGASPSVNGLFDPDMSCGIQSMV